METVTHEVQVFQYNNNPISFLVGEHKMINATQMSKGFGSGKRPKNFLALQSTKEIITALSEGRNLPSSDLVTVRHGDGGGTWMHEELAIIFAQWLSPQFYIWCNTQLKELLTNGQALLTKQHQAELDEVKCLLKFQTDRGTKNYTLYKEMEQRLEAMRNQKNNTALPSVKLYTTADIAKELGISEKELLIALMDEGVVILKRQNMWELTKYYRGNNYVRTRYNIKDAFLNTNTRYSSYLTWTEKGRKFVLETMVE